MDIVPIVSQTVSDVCDDHPSVNCSIDTPEQAISFAAPQLADALSELLENAARHAGNEPSIDVVVHQRYDQITEVHGVRSRPRNDHQDGPTFAGW